MTFEDILDHTFESDSDAGVYGITEDMARAHGHDGAIADLPLDVARAIMRKQYWEQIRGDEVLEISPALAEEMFECAVNCGPAAAVSILQCCLNCFNGNGTLYPNIEADGLAGPMTLAALRAYRKKRGVNWEIVLVRAANVLQGARYLAGGRPKDADFVYGWIMNQVQPDWKTCYWARSA